MRCATEMKQLAVSCVQCCWRQVFFIIVRESHGCIHEGAMIQVDGYANLLGRVICLRLHLVLGDKPRWPASAAQRP